MDQIQRVVLRNEFCLFVQKPQEVLLGSGLNVPRVQRENVFNLTSLEWQATLDLLHQVKALHDKEYKLDGYNEVGMMIKGGSVKRWILKWLCRNWKR
ncbi:hypothetical protein E2R56_26615 [Rhodococcus qingshengii]|nr:hypothetical protein E2R56_26615 [Rhodococcus qingshengii]